jgi:hypothetical protein
MTLPQLNLRDLFWLVVVVAMGVGGWTDHAQRTHGESCTKTMWKK